LCGWHSSILPGPGLLGGSTILSLEQLLFDMEMFRGGKQVCRGDETETERYLQYARFPGHFR
jgi:hypothetical protein